MIFCSSIVQGKQFLAILFFLFLFSLVFIPPLPAEDLSKDFSDSVVQTILCLRNPNSKLSASHINHPGYEDIAFLYDKGVDALILKSAGYQKEAEEILDYFAARLHIPMSELTRRADTNGVYGILKLFKPKDSNQKVKALINAVDITSLRRQGKGILEFWTTPGPTSFLIFAMLRVNAPKYTPDALMLGEALLAMQAPGGGVYDGDRAPEKIHTEPHMDAYSAFLMLYQLTGDKKWKKASDKAYAWFINNVYHLKEGTIDQGVWSGEPHTVFATDVYSWTMAGPAGDKLSTEALKKMTETMLSKSLVKITLTLPDSSIQTVTLCDFSNPEDGRVKEVRGRFHPMGSIEWTAGVILALQKNAVRFYNAKDIQSAVFYKAIAQVLTHEAIKCFYLFDEKGRKITFYATAQGLEVGPFGSLGGKLSSGWKTPFFYVKSPKVNKATRGGSIIGAWLLLPGFGINPFILQDHYMQTYNRIPLTQKDLDYARVFIDNKTAGRNFNEPMPIEAPLADTQIAEPELFNRKMWQAIDNAYAQKSRKDYVKAEQYFRQAIYWAKKTVDNPAWITQAKRDNCQKQQEIGGLISYPWGVTYADNDCTLHYAILRYPLLNEVAAAMWAMATAQFELGHYNETKYWMRRIIEEVPLHQIADTAQAPGEYKNGLIRGYWNALISWEDNPGGYKRDEEMKPLYLEVLREKGLKSAKPKVIVLDDADMH